MSGEHMLIRSDPELPGFGIVEPRTYDTIGRVWWEDHKLRVILFGSVGSIDIEGPHKLQNAHHWLWDRGRELSNDHGFILSGYIIACEQQEPKPCRTCQAPVGSHYATCPDGYRSPILDTTRR